MRFVGGLDRDRIRMCKRAGPTCSYPELEDRMKNRHYSVYALVAVGAVGLALLIGLTTGVGVYVGNRLAQDRMLENMPPIELQAGTAARTKSMSMATGSIDGNAEALFVLDHVTGNLQCWLLNAKTGRVGGIYRANAAGDLRVAGNNKQGAPEFLMTTGNFFFTGGNTGNNQPSNSICYVADANTGNVVGYNVIYNEQILLRGGVEEGALNLVCKGAARSAAVTRDQ